MAVTGEHEQVAGPPGSGADGEGASLVDLIEDHYGVRPSWRGWLHAAAFVLALPAGLYLLSAAETTAARVAVAVYWASLVGLFGTSATYHRLARSARAVLWFRRADHSMIFLLIAGTYTPVCLVALPAVWGIPMLVVAWVIALAGIIMKLVRLDTSSGSSGSWLYLALGWAAIVTLPALVESLDAVQLALMGMGGLLYTVGAVVLGRRRPDPIPHRFGYHEVWHAMTVAAGACHFVLIATIV